MLKSKDLFTGRDAVYTHESAAYHIRNVISEFGHEQESKFIALHAAMEHAAIADMIAAIPGIDNEHDARELVYQALSWLPAFETLTRGARREKAAVAEIFGGKPQKKNSPKIWYQNYLATKWWAEKRQEAYDFHGRKCFFCNRSEKINVHHRHYESLGSENARTDLSIFCEYHHEKLHNSGGPTAPYAAPQAALEKIALG